MQLTSGRPQNGLFYPLLGSKLLFQTRFVGNKLYCGVNQNGQLVTWLQTKNKLPKNT